MLAAAAHLSFLAGLWLVAAIADLLIERKESALHHVPGATSRR